MKFSLICTTRARNEELKLLFLSLINQSHQNFEVILVDQNPPGCIESVLPERPFSFSLRTIPVHSAISLSEARNIGLQWATGDIIAFPDDDCEYPEDLLAKVEGEFNQDTSLGVVSGSCRNRETLGFSAGRYVLERCMVTRKNLWMRHISVGLFIKKTVFDKVGIFDEDLGVGTWYGSGEETDFLLRILYHNFPVLYDADIYAFHPEPPKNDSINGLRRAKSYGLGWGALFKKHIIFYKQYHLLKKFAHSLLRSGGASIMYLVLGKPSLAKFYLYSTWGRLWGFFAFKTKRGAML